LGRKPSLRRWILVVLEETTRRREYPVFTVLKVKVAEKIHEETGRTEKVYDGTLWANLKVLIKKGDVEKVRLSKGEGYKTTMQFRSDEAKRLIVSVLQYPHGKKEEELNYLNLEEASAPVVAFCTRTSAKENELQTFVYPSLLDWGNVNEVIASRMLGVFSNLQTSEWRGAAKLLAHAYWCGVKNELEDMYSEKELGDLKSYVVCCIENAKRDNDQPGVEIEEAVLSLLEITTELTRSKNLKDFLDTLYHKKLDVEKLRSKIDEGHHEKAIFHRFFEFHSLITSGLEVADEKLESEDLQSRYLSSFSGIWDHFTQMVFQEFLSTDDLGLIQDDLTGAIKNVRAYRNYLKPLSELPSKSRMSITYLWGYSEIFKIADEEFLSRFEQWEKEIENGVSIDQYWMLPRIEERLIRAVKAVKRHKSPPPLNLDVRSSFTTKDLYNNHHEGKTVEFWEALLTKVRNARSRMKEKL